MKSVALNRGKTCESRVLFGPKNTIRTYLSYVL